jgi:hypothetical protein
VSRWGLVAWLFAACVHDTYRCEVDTDCNLGQGGRCEADRYCTHFDSGCQLTQRSYTDHSDALSGTCFLGEVTPLNYCASGQPPAVPTGCAARVCTTLSVCCTTGWSEACVLEAQQQCPEVQCETRIAVAATHGGVVEVYEARFDAGTWTGSGHPELNTAAAYLAPAPGSVEPRLAGFANPSQIWIESSTGKQIVDVDGTREYHDLLSLDFDRDLRDTLLLDYQDADAKTQLEQVLKLDTGESRDIDTGVSTRMAWGSIADSTGFVDGYPDGVAANGNAYKVLINSESNESTNRSLDTGVASSFDTINTTGAGVAIHSFSWIDVDGDGLLDLVAFGNSLRVHTGTITDTPAVEIDCSPPEPYQDCYASGGSAETAYNGTVIPSSGATPARILAAPYNFVAGMAKNTPSMFAITINSDHTYTSDPLTAASLDCGSCALEAVVVRDLDGDGHLDIVAVDTNLNFYTALWQRDHTLHAFTESHPVATPFAYGTVHTSVTGVPR